MCDARIAATLTDRQLEELVDEACADRIMTMLSGLDGMGLLAPCVAPEPTSASKAIPRAVGGHYFTLTTHAVLESPRGVPDVYRDSIMHARGSGETEAAATAKVVAAARAELAASEAAAELALDECEDASRASAAAAGGAALVSEALVGNPVATSEPRAPGVQARPNCQSTPRARHAAAAGDDDSAVVTPGAAEAPRSAEDPLASPGGPQAADESQTMAMPLLVDSQPGRARPKTVAELTTPDPGIHEVESVRLSEANGWHELTYNVSTWGGWIGFWDHCSYIRASLALRPLYMARKPFSGARDYLSSSRGPLATNILHVTRALAAERRERRVTSLPIAATRRVLSRVGVSLAEAADLRRTAVRSQKYSGAQRGRLGRLQAGALLPLPLHRLQLTRVWLHRGMHEGVDTSGNRGRKWCAWAGACHSVHEPP